GGGSEAEHLLHAVGVGLGDVSRPVQSTLARRGLDLEQVATVGLLPAQLAAAGDLHALLHPRVGLELRHLCSHFWVEVLGTSTWLLGCCGLLGGFPRGFFGRPRLLLSGSPLT